MDGWTNRSMERGTERRTDQRDFLGCSPTNIECPIYGV